MSEPFGETVGRRRRELRLTQEQLGSLAGVHRQTIRAVEMGKDISTSTATRVSRALNDEALRQKQNGGAPVPTGHGLYYVTRDGSTVYELTAEGAQLPMGAELAVATALVRYALNWLEADQ